MKKYLGVALLILAALAVVYFVPTKFNAPTEQQLIEKQASESLVSVSIDFGQSDVRIFDRVEWRQGMSAFDALKAAADKANLKMEFQDYGKDLGMFVKTIDGKPARGDTSVWWQFWVNGQYSHIGSSSYIIKAGDTIEWKLTTEQPN